MLLPWVARLSTLHGCFGHVGHLPAAAWEDGHEDWEALFRVVNGVCNLIEAIAKQEDISTLSLSFGKASEPGPASERSSSSPIKRCDAAGHRESRAAGIAAWRRICWVPGAVGEVANVELSAGEVLRRQGHACIEFNVGAGAGLVSALAAFERAFNTIASFPTASVATQSDCAKRGRPIGAEPRGRFAVFVAGAILLR